MTKQQNKEYKCPHCPTTSSSAGGLRDHRYRKHQDEIKESRRRQLLKRTERRKREREARQAREEKLALAKRVRAWRSQRIYVIDVETNNAAGKRWDTEVVQIGVVAINPDGSLEKLTEGWYFKPRVPCTEDARRCHGLSPDFLPSVLNQFYARQGHR